MLFPFHTASLLVLVISSSAGKHCFIAKEIAVELIAVGPSVFGDVTLAGFLPPPILLASMTSYHHSTTGLGVLCCA